MSSPIEVGNGFCLAFGGTNAREAYIELGDVVGFKREGTPYDQDQFFKWIARRVLEASDKGAEWTVIGLPGPVKRGGGNFLIGPMANIPDLSENEYDLEVELGKADPAVSRLLDDGFSLEATNDGDLAAQAAVHLVEADDPNRYNIVGNVIDGSGLGASIAIRDMNHTCVFRPPGFSIEIGHNSLGVSYDPKETYENRYSGTALGRKYGAPLETLPSDSPAWRDLGLGIGVCAMNLAQNFDAEVVVPSGGAGIGGYDKYRGYLDLFLWNCTHRGNATQQKFVPKIVRVPLEEEHTYELRGAEGYMRHIRTHAA